MGEQGGEDGVASHGRPGWVCNEKLAVRRGAWGACRAVWLWWPARATSYGMDAPPTGGERAPAQRPGAATRVHGAAPAAVLRPAGKRKKRRGSAGSAALPLGTMTTHSIPAAPRYGTPDRGRLSPHPPPPPFPAPWHAQEARLQTQRRTNGSRRTCIRMCCTQPLSTHSQDWPKGSPPNESPFFPTQMVTRRTGTLANATSTGATSQREPLDRADGPSHRRRYLPPTHRRASARRRT